PMPRVWRARNNPGRHQPDKPRPGLTRPRHLAGAGAVRLPALVDRPLWYALHSLGFPSELGNAALMPNPCVSRRSARVTTGQRSAPWAVPSTCPPSIRRWPPFASA
ncbi:MAG: hypothetical protein ACRYG8_49910, partial [Janthinobacterium lividum]